MELLEKLPPCEKESWKKPASRVAQCFNGGYILLPNEATFLSSKDVCLISVVPSRVLKLNTHHTRKKGVCLVLVVPSRVPKSNIHHSRKKQISFKIHESMIPFLETKNVSRVLYLDCNKTGMR